MIFCSYSKYVHTFIKILFSFFQVFWRRKQSMAAMKWGTAGFEDVEQDRPLFEGININSPVNGREMTYFPNSKKMNRTNIALVILFFWVFCFYFNFILFLVYYIFFNLLRHRNRYWNLPFSILVKSTSKTKFFKYSWS